MDRLVLVGATGSIGSSTLDVVRALAPAISLYGVFAGRNAEALGTIAREFSTEYAGLHEEAPLDAPGRTGSGAAFLEEAIAGCDIVLNAATGAGGLSASMLAVRHGKRLALANKESMVMAGPLLLREAERTGALVLPVDSEHSAIFQALHAGKPSEVRRILLTASGGPFRTWTRERIASATREDALHHPTWSMGPKITIDSATMMNKALELVEAHWLFDLERGAALDVVVHPQSLVHSLVEFVDGSIMAQMGRPDMRVPIQYALTYPERRGPAFTSFQVRDFAQLTFEEPDRERFPAIRHGERAVELGGTAGTVLNAANEVAVARFLEGHLSFPAIAETVGAVLEGAQVQPDPDLDDIYEADRSAREDAIQCCT